MYSLNVPVPGAVGKLATDLGRDLVEARVRARGEHTLVCKRLGGGDAARYHDYEARARDALAGSPAFEARVTGVDYFAEAADGASPVVYLAVESPGLVALHERLAAAFEPVDGIEGEDYVPHVTIGRGGSLDRARDLAAREVDPIEWTVDRLVFWDAEREQAVSSVSLPV